MKRAMLIAVPITVAAVLSACAGNDGKREGEGVATPSAPSEPQRQSADNPNAPASNPNAPLNDSESPLESPAQPLDNPAQPEDPGYSPGPAPTGTGGPGGPPIQCARLCEDFSEECATACQQACSPYDGLQFPCRDELEDLLECYLDLCESGGQSGTCEGETSALSACAEGLDQ